MTARFAGSRTLDERRRRWLAANEMEQAGGTNNAGSSRQQAREEPVRAEARITQFPLRKVISPKGWKIACVGFLAFLVGAGVVALGHADVPLPKWLQPARSRLFETASVKLPRLLHAALLMASGQLALLIWWGRSRSLRDFDGRYRVWVWSAFAATFAGWSLLGEWHWALSETICGLWSAKFPMREVVCWMFPACLVAGLLWRKLRADIRDCRWSTCFFWLAAASCLAACVFRLGIDRTGWPGDLKQLAAGSLQMLASVSLFVSFLVHTRFVLHVSPEPPEYRPSLWAKLSFGAMAVLRKLPKPRLKLGFPWKSGTKKPKEAAKSSTATAKKTTGETKNATGSQPRKTNRRKQPAAKASNSAAKSKEPKPAQPNPSPAPASAKTETKPAESKPESNPPDKSQERSAPTKDQKAETAPTKQQASESNLRVDQPLDPEMLKGLSKKERRRLRKQHREAQRKPNNG